jgi:hypothetical protein
MLQRKQISSIICGLINYIFLGGTNYKCIENSWNWGKENKIDSKIKMV